MYWKGGHSNSSLGFALGGRSSTKMQNQDEDDLDDDDAVTAGNMKEETGRLTLENFPMFHVSYNDKDAALPPNKVKISLSLPGGQPGVEIHVAEDGWTLVVECEWSNSIYSADILFPGITDPNRPELVGYRLAKQALTERKSFDTKINVPMPFAVSSIGAEYRLLPEGDGVLKTMLIATLSAKVKEGLKLAIK